MIGKASEIRTLEIEVITGRDLVVSFKCDCPSVAFIGTPIEQIMKHKINLYGYNDPYFFDTVNKEPINIECKCGKVYQYQWKREGVEVSRIPEEVTQ